MDDFSAWPMGEISVDLFNFTLIFHGNDDSAGERITWFFISKKYFFRHRSVDITQKVSQSMNVIFLRRRRGGIRVTQKQYR